MKDLLGRLMSFAVALVGEATLALITMVGLFFVCCGGLVWHTIRLDLLHRPATDIFTYMFAWGLIWVFTLVSIFVDHYILRRTAGSLLAIVALWLGLQTLAYYVPAVGTWLHYSNDKMTKAADLATQEAPVPSTCNRATYQHITFFATDPKTGERIPRIWYSERQGIIACFDRKGFDPVYGTDLKPITKAIVLQIAEQEPPRPPATPQPVSTPAPSPAPETTTIVWGPEQLVPLTDEEPGANEEPSS